MYQANFGSQVYPAGGDIITTANGDPVETIADLQRLVLASEEGDEVQLEVWRNGEVREVSLTLQVVEEEAPPSEEAE
ncbi:MAG TPA: PDZ domain-containing protein, partial [Trueperaceae bacterium]|nr:PDZ domain-containing protein [Trueperaceae bacterium]